MSDAIKAVAMLGIAVGSFIAGRAIANRQWSKKLDVIIAKTEDVRNEARKALDVITEANIKVAKKPITANDVDRIQARVVKTVETSQTIADAAIQKAMQESKVK